jgi:hypothetical protein
VRSVAGGRFGRIDGQHDPEFGSLAGRAGDIDPAFVPADDAEYEGKAQAGANADRLGGKKRLKDAVEVLGRDALAVITDADPDLAGFLDSRC